MKTRTLIAAVAFLALLAAPELPAQELSDAEVAHIAVTANQIDITAAEQALEKSSHADVRSFAETMIRDHRSVIEQAAALAERLGVTPADNETSQVLLEQAEETRTRLARLDGDAFDRAYAEHEVAYHETVITAVRETLIPNTSNSELRELLEGALPLFEAHLEHARRVSEQLGGR